MIKPSITFLAYSDIHYHQYTNGITLADVEQVENDALDLAIAHKVDFILFGGDRYVSRNPMYESAFASDRVLRRISNSGIPWLGLVGNHCRLTKNDFKAHSLSHVSLYKRDLAGITIMDQRTAYVIPVRDCSVAIHAVPAGHEPNNFTIAKDIDFHICMFHALIMGSSFHNGTLVETGLSVSSFNERGFDLVLAGDNHKRQQIKGLTDCQGYFLGAPMQHNWGDEGAERGYTIFTLDKAGLVGTPEFIPSRSPKFTRATWVVDDISKLALPAQHDTGTWENNIIKLLISGPADVLNSIDIDTWKSKLINISKARTIDIRLDYVAEDSPHDIYQSVPVTDADEWKSYVAGRQHELDQVDVEYLEKLGTKYITES